MSRLKLFARGVFSGYVQMAANVVYTLLSVPLALHYLSKEEFALWALVAQITGYFGLVDLGMSASVSRTLADHKDDRDGGKYGGVLKSGAIVFCVQGLLIAVSAWYLAPPLVAIFAIESKWSADFVLLLRGCGFVLAFDFVMKIWSAPFWAFQRYDVGNYSISVSFALQLGVLWVGFTSGLGLKSMILSYAAQTLLTSFWCLIAGLVYGFYPKRGAWGRVESGALAELFTFGRDMFLLAIGAQLLTASQVIIVTRLFGLEAAATWAICSKIYTLAQQGVGRIFDASAGALTEMFVRHEETRLQARFRDVVALTASFSVAVAAVVLTANASFVHLWTKGRVAWPFAVDILLGVLLVVICVNRCFVGIAGITKEIRQLRFVYFIEGVLFVVLSWFAGERFGFAGVGAASIVATMICSGSYGLVRIRRQWQWSSSEILTLFVPAGRVLACVLPPAFLIHQWMGAASGPGNFALFAGLLTLTALASVWWTGVPAALKSELSSRLSGRHTPAG